MASMENAIHAKSYSNIFMTLLPGAEIDELFAWGEKQKNLQNIMNLIVGYYKILDNYSHAKHYDADNINFTDEEFREAQWKAMTASVFLESWLFYSGFFYPLYFYGQGKMMQSGEIINLIIRDESIHGMYVGKLAQEIFETFTEEKQIELTAWMKDLLHKLYHEQLELTHEVYDTVDIALEVCSFVRYNANKALMNLGFDPEFEHEEVNPLVINGLNTETKTHDFFSMKGTGYQKMKTESLKDSDFFFKEPKRGNI
jgi:ribonucleoside-diphosphate reductase beta chain